MHIGQTQGQWEVLKGLEKHTLSSFCVCIGDNAGVYGQQMQLPHRVSIVPQTKIQAKQEDLKFGQNIIN